MLEAGCLDSQPVTFLPTAHAASPPVRLLPHSPPPIQSSSQFPECSPASGSPRGSGPRLRSAGAVWREQSSRAELRGLFPECFPLHAGHRQLGIPAAWTRREDLGGGALCLSARVEGGRRGRVGVFPRLPMWVGETALEARVSCLPFTHEGPLFVPRGVKYSPGTQGPYSESQATSPWCRLPAPREVAESGSRTLVLRGPSRHLPLYLQESSFSSLQWPRGECTDLGGPDGEGRGGPASVALPAGLGLLGSRPLETTGPGLQASWRWGFRTTQL